MNQELKLKMIFWGSLLSGIGLCIGGIFLTALIMPGCVLLAASFAMYQSAYSNNVQPEMTEIASHNDLKAVPITIDNRHVSMTYQFNISRLRATSSSPPPMILESDSGATTPGNKLQSS